MTSSRLSKSALRTLHQEESSTSRRHEDYTVGWICTLAAEMAAARLMLDEVHSPLPQPPGDGNVYVLGRIGNHNIVIASLPSGEYGLKPTAAVVIQMSSTFHSVRFVLSVGIGSGVPSSNADIRLGDVVVSQPTDTAPGVIQYDYGKELNGRVEHIARLNRPPVFLSSALVLLHTAHAMGLGRMGGYISDIQAELPPDLVEHFSRPEEDYLFKTEYVHVGLESCADCDPSQLILRPEREHEEPVVHYGLIASGNQVVRDGVFRDRIGQELGAICLEMEAAGLIAFGNQVVRDGVFWDRIDQELGAILLEMEAAGLMDTFPGLVIRGISDYADSHKNRAWQGYAAVAASACAKELLLMISADRINSIPRAQVKVSDSASGPVPELSPLTQPRNIENSGGSDSNPELGPQRERTSIAPPTDSGYASTTQQKVPHPEEYPEYVHDVETIAPGEEGLPLPSMAASPRNTEGGHGDDAESIYTAGPGISPSHQQSYISELVDDLFRKVQCDQAAQHLPERIHGILLRLLKAFAIRFGQSGPTQVHRDIMVFIRRHRSEIATGLKMKYMEDELSDSQVTANDDNKMDLRDLMDLWHQKLDDDFDIPHIDTEAERSAVDDDIPTEDDGNDLPGLGTYRDLIMYSPVYKWLLGSLRRELDLQPAEPDARGAIRNRILDSLPFSRIVSRYDQPRIYQVKFTLNWDLMAFVKEQEYDTNKEGFLGRIITITGTRQDAQAMTCLQYLHQTWQSFGANIIQLLEATLLDGPGYKHRCALPDNTQLAAWVDEKDLLVEVTGIGESIAEIGEQLAWLGAALRPSSHDSRISYCTPFISSASVENTSGPTSQAPPITRISCGIDFKLNDQQQANPPLSVGQCWHHLFRNPIVVTGFPIPYRSRQGTGLEVPLNILAGIIHASRVDAFRDKLFIKGFSSLLIPTEHIRDQNQIMWHLRYNVRGDRISYLDGIESHAGHITLADLESSRHILGWCSDARCYAGAADASYSIDRSWLPPPSSRCSLSNTFIAAGRLVTGGDQATYGNKDLPYRIIRDEYIEKLLWIARQYVVMWDAGEKRGWLVNGACALLHLLLASLYFNRNDPLGFAFRLSPSDVKGPEKIFTPSSAMEVLLNPDNLSLQLYHANQGEPDDTTLPQVRIRDRVDRLYNVLEKIMDHQAEIIGPDRGASRDMARSNLEGWDFKDLATQEDPLCPRVCKLGTRGKSWVDFTRDIHAATLFGTGFGEILRPVNTRQPCPYWSRLPEGQSYLAVSGYDLANIIDRFGNPNSSPVRLTSNLIWCNSPDNVSPTCKCIGCPEQTEHSELAQVILPLHFRRRIQKHNTIRSRDWGHGAVIFGYNRDFRWSWNDTGFPEQEDVLSSSNNSESDSDDDFHDSGLGASLAPSATVEGPRELPLSRSLPQGITHEDYEVGIVCALWKELLAVRALFDLPHPDLGEKDENDPNSYCLGRMKGFNVVAAGLPDDDYGMNSATNVASHLIRTFRRLKFCLVVGIGGGVPSAAQNIRLGDIVVSTGVIQADIGKLIQDSEFRITAEKQRPPPFLRAVITKIRSNGLISFDSALNPLLDDLNLIASKKLEYQYPGADRDLLFDPDYVHVKGESTCDNCIGSRRLRSRQHDGPKVFYGLIASGNQVVRDARHRDRLGRENVICVEMEGAGVMRTTGCLVIRGICDYADSHKNKQWQEYAAATAAAYAKFFLSQMRESVHETAVRVPSRLEEPTGPGQLQKEKRAAPRADHAQALLIKRARRY
ncbi:purine and uridine phosphorylase [Aspergillus novoparasiticus]|uniref:Purine and uridine phosphorylase n=1 Tax=Aspergillus novoparasiticus TaxID=986946 RepID=A0A5N6EHF8_9EURO|nr:purine and uridine phosphorylase [Aspergillus novoparasiticus]